MSEPIRDLESAVRELGALPMPVGPEPQADDRTKAPWGCAEDGRPLLPMGAHWTDVPELVDRHLAGIQARVDQAQPGHWYEASATEMGVAPGTVRTRVDGFPRVVGQFTNMLPADLELVLHAHVDLSWCLEMIAKLQARVAGLAAERHETNEIVSDSAEALRANRDRIAELEAASVLVCRECAAPVRWVENSNGGWWNHTEPASDVHSIVPKPSAAPPADSYPPALPWARLMDHEDLADFLDELAASAITHATAEVALTEVEETCGRWRMIAEAQHGHNTAPGPDAEEDCDHPNGYGPNGCAGCGAFRPTDDDVTPQVAKLRTLLAGQREQTGGAS